MSHPIFLNSSPYLRMPDGAVNEWRAYWLRQGPELESNATFPLLWCALFSPKDLKWARRVDDEDLDSEGREELLSFEEAVYPYLVTSVDDALTSLTARRAALLKLLGARYEPIIDAFAALIRTRFLPFVLLRTSGLPDVEDAGPQLERMLRDWDDLESTSDLNKANSVSSAVDCFHRYSSQDAIRLLTGSSTQDGWPSDGLAMQFPRLPASRAGKASGKKNARRRLPKWLAEWIAPVVLGISTVAAYLYTQSWWVSAGSFVIIAFAFVWTL